DETDCAGVQVGTGPRKKQFVPPPARRWRSRLRRGSRIFSLLVAFFPPRFEHLIVSCLLDTFDHEMLTDALLFLCAGTRYAVPFGTGDDAPFFGHLGIIGSFLGRDVVFFAH